MVVGKLSRNPRQTMAATNNIILIHY